MRFIATASLLLVLGLALPALAEEAAAPESSTEVLTANADRVQDEQDRLRLAFKLFDSEGARFVGVLQEGGKALTALRNEARETGAVIEDETVEETQELNAELDKLKQITGARLNEALLSLRPVLIKIAEAAAEAADAFGSLVANFQKAEDLSSRRLRKEIEELDSEIAELEKLQERLGGPGSLGFEGPGYGAVLRKLIERRNNLIQEENRRASEEQEAVAPGVQTPSEVEQQLDLVEDIIEAEKNRRLEAMRALTAEEKRTAELDKQNTLFETRRDVAEGIHGRGGAIGVLREKVGLSRAAFSTCSWPCAGSPGAASLGATRTATQWPDWRLPSSTRST